MELINLCMQMECHVSQDYTTGINEERPPKLFDIKRWMRYGSKLCGKSTQLCSPVDFIFTEKSTKGIRLPVDLLLLCFNQNSLNKLAKTQTVWGCLEKVFFFFFLCRKGLGHNRIKTHSVVHKKKSVQGILFVTHEKSFQSSVSSSIIFVICY